jgi:hypothetical protein
MLLKYLNVLYCYYYPSFKNNNKWSYFIFIKIALYINLNPLALKCKL